MGWFREKQMTWAEFERVCVELVKRCFPNDYKIEPHRSVEYNGKTLIMDIYLAEEKKGGKRYVIDCKHYAKVALPKAEVDSTLRYKTQSRASKAIMLISGATKIVPGLDEYAKSKGVLVIPVSTFNSEVVNVIRNFFGVEKELKRIIR